MVIPVLVNRQCALCGHNPGKLGGSIICKAVSMQLYELVLVFRIQIWDPSLENLLFYHLGKFSSALIMGICLPVKEGVGDILIKFMHHIFPQVFVEVQKYQALVLIGAYYNRNSFELPFLPAAAKLFRRYSNCLFLLVLVQRVSEGHGDALET